MLEGLGRAMIPVLVLFSGIRIGDLLLRGRGALLFTPGRYAFLFWLETFLFIAPIFLLRTKRQRLDGPNLFRVATLLMAAGGLYRFDTFLLAFNPGPNFSYFPSVAETLVTVGLVAFEILAYIVVVKMFPILAGVPKRAAVN
jgi:Ni/Fe-hydrogenase subunit HybB-like protein